MKTLKYTLIAFLLLIASNSIFAQADVPLVVQEQTNWCWAANTRSIMDYYDVNPGGQCDIATYAYNKSKNCCSNGRSCNQMNGMQSGDVSQGPKVGMLEICTDYGKLKADHYRGPLSIAKLEKANEEKRPFIVGCMWNGQNGGHVVVGYAYEKNYVSVMDPWRNNGRYTFKHGSNISLNGSRGRWTEGVEITQQVLSVDQKFKASINIYPTLVKHVLNIELENHTTANLKLYNALGSNVLTTKLTGNKMAVNLSNISSGVYFAKISNDSSKEATFKIIKD